MERVYCMKLKLLDKVREFVVKGVTIKDQGKIYLDENELVSFVTKSGKEYDFVAKEWGFYASPSLNDRLVREGFRSAIVMNKNNQIYLMVIEEERIDDFERYINENTHEQKVISWLEKM